jgi:hypothetical protein
MMMRPAQKRTDPTSYSHSEPSPFRSDSIQHIHSLIWVNHDTASDFCFGAMKPQNDLDDDVFAEIIKKTTKRIYLTEYKPVCNNNLFYIFRSR